MDALNQGQEPITPEGGTPTVPETVTLTKAEADELQHKAEVSSQNFERLKKAEADLKALRESNLQAPSQDYSDEGRMLKGEIETLRQELTANKQERELTELQAKFPALKDKIAEFEIFKQEYPTYKTENIAKLFLVENGLLGEPSRLGLERPTGGPRTSGQVGMTPQDVDDLRVNNFRLYKEKLLSGEIKV